MLHCCPEVRGFLFQSGVRGIDYEDLLPMNASFEMTEDDIRLVSFFLFDNKLQNEEANVKLKESGIILLCD